MMSESFRSEMMSVRVWLRRVMPRVAAVAVASFFVRLLFRRSAIYQSDIGDIFSFLTFAALTLTLVYYGYKWLRWLKSRLLWRVRRRLVITYLFVGLTPIVLLALLGFFASIGISSQAIGRIVTVQVNDTERHALESARAIAYSLSRIPPNTGDRAVQTWLDERAALLRAALPGARVTAWRGRAGEFATLGLHGDAAFVSAGDAEETRPARIDEGRAGGPLPEWLRGRNEWSGLTFVPPPEDSDEVFGVPSVRALSRVEGGGQAFAVEVSVPVSRALIKRLQEGSGLRVRPFFLGVDIGSAGERNVEVKIGDSKREVWVEQSEGEVVTMRDRRGRRIDFQRDQFGEPLELQGFMETPYPVYLPATDWLDGTRSQRFAFLVVWSWGEAGRQLLGDNTLGQFWRTSLGFVAVAFLALELLALLSAAWMTRAVTGAVHKLYRATEFIKRGDFSHRVPVRSHDQLGELATAFNDMSANIESLLAERVEHERLEREIEIAAEVQAQLFPRSVPALETADIEGECRAARGVAGDYYDYMRVAPGLIAFALGDVSGKGISAALVMSNLQASLRAQVASIVERLKGDADTSMGPAALTATVSVGDAPGHLSPAVVQVKAEGIVSHIVASINAHLCQSTEANRFATFFLALYDERARLLRYTNAGHNAGVLVRADGTIERLTAGGTMVGAFDWARFEEAEATLLPGDLLLVFSDGLSEAQNAHGEEYGEERLVRFVVAHRELPADELRHALFAEVDQWSGAKERDDDQTLLILKTR